MNKEMLREKLSNEQGNNFHFIFNGSRNQTEEFYGTIVDTFQSVFLIEAIEENPRIRSFSYNDIITSSLEIREK